MQYLCLLPDAILYSALVSACEKAALLQRALHQCLCQALRTGSTVIGACDKAAAESLAVLRSQGAPRPPARCTHLPCFDQCLRSGCRREPCSSSKPCCVRPPAKRDHLLFFDQCLRQGFARRCHLQRVRSVLARRAKVTRRAFDVGTGMLRQALLPIIVNYNALISACEKGAKMRRSLRQDQGLASSIRRPCLRER